MALPLSYNLRNLTVRKLSTGLTFVVVAVVVLVLAVLMSFAEGIRASLAASGHATNVIVIKPGATAESTSIILNAEMEPVMQTPGVAVDGGGRQLISREICVQTSIPRRGPDAVMANVAVRGVEDVAFDVHPEVRVIEGRRFGGGEPECIVGRQAREQFASVEVGDEIKLGRLSNRGYKVVGVFAAAGGAFESEIWTSRTSVASAFDRHIFSSATLRVQDAAAVQPALDYLNGPSAKLNAKLETAYYDDLTKQARDIVTLTTILVAIMAIGAVFAVANTMYAAVDARRREIAMLRTLGFSRGAILTSFLAESLLICMSACVVGFCLSLFMNGMRQDYLSDMTWTVLAYELKLTPAIFGYGLLLSVLVGVIGAMAPAWRASRVRIIEALRKA